MTASDPCPRFPWYALKVRTRGEAFISTSLRSKSYETFLPTFTESKVYSDRIKKVQAPLFPGYLFCRLDAERRLPILQTPGIEYIVSLERVPQPIPEEEIASILRVVQGGAVAKPWPYLKNGDRVCVMYGSFSGVEGILVSEKGSDRLILSVNLLQRSVSVEIDRAWIQPLK